MTVFQGIFQSEGTRDGRGPPQRKDLPRSRSKPEILSEQCQIEIQQAAKSNEAACENALVSNRVKANSGVRKYIAWTDCKSSVSGPQHAQ